MLKNQAASGVKVLRFRSFSLSEIKTLPRLGAVNSFDPDDIKFSPHSLKPHHLTRDDFAAGGWPTINRLGIAEP